MSGSPQNPLEHSVISWTTQSILVKQIPQNLAPIGEQSGRLNLSGLSCFIDQAHKVLSLLALERADDPGTYMASMNVGFTDADPDIGIERDPLANYLHGSRYAIIGFPAIDPEYRTNTLPLGPATKMLNLLVNTNFLLPMGPQTVIHTRYFKGDQITKPTSQTWWTSILINNFGFNFRVVESEADRLEIYERDVTPKWIFG